MIRALAWSALPVMAVLVAVSMGVQAAEGVERCEDDGSPQQSGTCRGVAYVETSGINCYRWWAVSVHHAGVTEIGNDGPQDLPVSGSTDNPEDGPWNGTTGQEWFIQTKSLTEVTGSFPTCPQAADTGSIRIWYEDETVTPVFTACDPCSSTDFNKDSSPGVQDKYVASFNATDDLTATGDPLAGTLRIEITVEGDIGAGSYTASSDGDEADDSFSMKGFIRAGSDIHSSSDTEDKPLYAVGAAADQELTWRVNQTPPFTAGGSTDMQVDLERVDTGSTVHTASSTPGSDGIHSFTADTVDQTEYPQDTTGLNASLTVTGASTLSGYLWTELFGANEPETASGAFNVTLAQNSTGNEGGKINEDGLSVHPSGDWFVSASDQGLQEVASWSWASDGTFTQIEARDDIGGSTSDAEWIEFHPSGDFVAAGMRVGKILVYGFDDNTGALSLISSVDTIECTGNLAGAWHPSGQYLATALGTCDAVRLYRFNVNQTLSFVQDFPGSWGVGANANFVDWSFDRAFVTTQDFTDNIRVFDLDPATGAVSQASVASVLGDRLHSVAADKEGSRILVGSKDKIGLFNVSGDGSVAFTDSETIGSNCKCDVDWADNGQRAILSSASSPPHVQVFNVTAAGFQAGPGINTPVEEDRNVGVVSPSGDRYLSAGDSAPHIVSFTLGVTGDDSDPLFLVDGSTVNNPLFAYANTALTVVDGQGLADRFSSDQELYNRGETVSYDFTMVNAATENITREVTVDHVGDATTTDSQSLTPDSEGLVTGSYVLASTDPATADTTGIAYHIEATITSAAGTDAESGEDYAVSSLYFIDTHPQADSTLVKDDFPAEDNTETHQFTVGDATSHTWCHVVGVRLDGTEINTTGSAVNITILDPDGDVLSAGDFDTEGDGWTDPQHEQDSVSPAGTYTFTCTVEFDGNTGTSFELVGFASSFTGNKVCLLETHGQVTTGEVATFIVRVERNDDPVAPDTVPRFSMSHEDSFDWVQVVNSDGDPMTNAVNWTTTVNGSLYVYNTTIPSNVPDINVRVLCNILGTQFRTQQVFATDLLHGLATNTTLAEDPISALQLKTGLGGLDWIAYVGMAITSLILWSRSHDYVVEVFLSLLVIVIGFMGVWSASDWVFLGTSGVLLAITGAYLLVRSSLDRFTEASA